MDKLAHSLNENFTGTKPEAIEFQGKYIPVTSTVNILIFILEYCISTDSKKIEKMLSEDYLKGFLCSHLSSSVRRPKELSNGMLLERNNNSKDFYKAIKKVLKYFEIDEGTVRIFLKDDKKEEQQKNETTKGIVINSYKFKNC